MDPNIKKFLQNLILEAGMGEAPVSDQEAMIQDLYVRLEDRLMLAVMDSLAPEKKSEFEAKIEEEDLTAAQVEEYIRKNVPGYEQVFAKAFAEFRELYLSGAAQ
jgi:hypothetical protein